MVDNFRVDGLKFLINQNLWTNVERKLLEIMLGAAASGIFADEINRMWSREPDAEMILRNIIVKATGAGLVPTLEFLKEAHDRKSEIQCDVPLEPAPAQAKPGLH